MIQIETIQEPRAKWHTQVQNLNSSSKSTQAPRFNFYGKQGSIQFKFITGRKKRKTDGSRTNTRSSSELLNSC